MNAIRPGDSTFQSGGPTVFIRGTRPTLHQLHTRLHTNILSLKAEALQAPLPSAQEEG
ncbi:Hypothetical predicted protein, partial [Marmota monax]